MTELRGTFCHRAAPAERLLSYRHALRVFAFICFIVPCVPPSVHTQHPKTHRCRPPISAALRVTEEERTAHGSVHLHTHTHTHTHSLWNRCEHSHVQIHIPPCRSVPLWGARRACAVYPCTETHRHLNTRPHTADTLSITPRAHSRHIQTRYITRDGSLKQTAPFPHTHSYLHTPYRCIQMYLYLYICTHAEKYERLQHPGSHLCRH